MTSRALLGARTLALCSRSLLVPVAVFAAQSAAPAAPASPWWPPSPLEVALAWPVLTGIASLVYSKLDANSRAHAIFAMLASVGLDLPALGASISKAVTGKYSLATKARAAQIAGSALVVLAFTGCVSSAPVVPVTPDNAAQVSSCQNTAAWHNDLVVGDFVVGGAGAGLGAAAAIVPASNASLKDGLAIGSGAAGAIAAGLTGLVAFTTSNFQNSQCQSVVGPLPASPFGRTKPDGGAQ